MLHMTPKQLDTLSALYAKSRESITLANVYGRPGCILATFWLIGGQCAVKGIDHEGKEFRVKT